MEPLTLQGIFQSYFSAYAEQRKLPLMAWRAANALMRCRTPMMGGHVQRCPQGHMHRVQYHSCRHRSCAQCSRRARAQWAQVQAARLLACEHYHVVFTLPHELLALWEHNRAEMARLLFVSVRDTLMTLLADRRFLGATPGIVMALHTWGRTLNHHPHVHALVSGGGVTAAGDWKAVTRGYLLPVRVVKALFRGKLLAAIAAGVQARRLQLPVQMTPLVWARTRQALARKNCNVCIRERYAHGHGVMKYLARYVKGGPLGNSRLRFADAAHVVFAYQDHRDGRHKTMRLSSSEFFARLLWHVPVPRQHTIRHAGLYASAARAQHAKACARLAEILAPAPAGSWQNGLMRLGHGPAPCCPRCGSRLVRAESLPPVRSRNENSVYKAVPHGFAQRVAQADTPHAPPFTERGPPPDRDIFLCNGVRLS